jgi:hypothetical protein
MSEAILFPPINVGRSPQGFEAQVERFAVPFGHHSGVIRQAENLQGGAVK